MTNRSRSVSGAARLFGCFAVAAILGLAGPALAGQATGVSALERVDLSARTVTLRGETYRFTDATQILGTKGESTRLDRLQAAPEGVQLIEVGDADVVTWKAVSTPKGWVLTELRVLEAMPD